MLELIRQASTMDRCPAGIPSKKVKEELASKEDRKKTAVRRMETLSPPSTSTPMAMRASIHLHSHRALSAIRHVHACVEHGMCRKECQQDTGTLRLRPRVRVACLSGSFWYTP